MGNTRPGLLILDEATTALDTDTEAAVCDALDGLKGRMTMVAVSHQPAIRRVSDRVYGVNEGQVRLTQHAAEPEVAR